MKCRSQWVDVCDAKCIANGGELCKADSDSSDCLQNQNKCFIEKKKRKDKTLVAHSRPPYGKPLNAFGAHSKIQFIFSTLPNNLNVKIL